MNGPNSTTMPNEKHALAAVHHFYVLKEDQAVLQKLWSGLTSEATGKTEQPPLPALPETGAGPATYCQIVSRMRGEDLDFCLLMLADLSVMQVFYHIPGATSLGERWAKALSLVEKDRGILNEEVTIFGESTLLVLPGDAGEDFACEAASVSQAATVLRSDIDPSAAGGGKPAMLNLLDGKKTSPDLFALAARDPDAVISSIFPQIDSLIKKLARTSAYFEEQRSTIVGERTGVDREIGALLHRQVVISATGERADPAGLEKQIDSLSRMFGVLATDSLLVRQAGDRLERDIGLLHEAMGQLARGANGIDEVGTHYLRKFRADLEAARGENQNLDFSRQNAQAGIEVVRTQVELLRAGEEAATQEQTKELLSHSLVLQKERLSLQVAAGLVEFVLVFYYLLKSWEGIAGQETVEHLPPVIRMAVVGSMSASATIGTHFLARTISSRSLKNTGLWLSVAALVLSFAAMVILTIVEF